MRLKKLKNVFFEEHVSGQNKYIKKRNEFNLLNIPSSAYIDDEEKSVALYDTLATLKRSDDNSKSVDHMAQLNYQFYLHYPNLNIAQKSFIYITQAFLKPHFFLYSIFVVACSAIYYFFFNFKEQSYDTFGNALYFSIITFTTTGYGDISPSGWGKVVACSESILGIILISCFIVSLVRKYFER